VNAEPLIDLFTADSDPPAPLAENLFFRMPDRRGVVAL
jgi:hypothetical protein